MYIRVSNLTEHEREDSGQTFQLVAVPAAQIMVIRLMDVKGIRVGVTTRQSQKKER
jgi:hypothetical protein